MTVVDAMPSPSSLGVERDGQFFDGQESLPVTIYDQLLDITTEFVGEAGTRGIQRPTGLVCIKTGTSHGVKSWEFAMPAAEPALQQRGSKEVMRFASFPDGVLLEDKATLPGPLHENPGLELVNFRDVQPQDVLNLGLLQEAIEASIHPERAVPPRIQRG
jgi:hypothetical protein